MGFDIRLATAQDSGAAIEVVRAVYEEYGFTWDESDYHADLYNLEDYYLFPGHPFWIAVGENGPIGTAALEKFEVIPGPRRSLVEAGGALRVAGCDCALQRLYVKSDARSKGVGSALFQTVIDSARAEHRRAMEIWSDKRFLAAHRLYERSGAELVGDRVCHDPDHSPEWGLWLELQ